MKFKNIFLPLFGVVTLLAASCTDEVEYTPAAPTDTDEVYFPNTQPTDISLAENATEFSVTIERLKADNELTVNLQGTVVDPDGNPVQDLFTVPANVQFADGIKTASIPVAVNFANVVADTDYTLVIKASSDQLSIYGDTEIELVVCYSPWSEWALISQEPAIGSLGNPWAGEEINSVAYYRHSMLDSNLEQYLIGGPRYSNLNFNFELSINRTQTYDIDGTTCYKVTMPLTDTHYDKGDQRIMYIDAFTWMRAYGAKDGASMSDEQIEAIMASNGFGRSYFNPQTGQFALWLVPCVKGEELRRYPQSYTYINLPGYKQYSVEFSYSGNFVDGTGMESAIITALKSDDITSYKYEIVAGNLSDSEIAAAAAALADDSSAEVVSDANYTIVYTPEAAGIYTIVAVGFDGDEVVYNTSYKFEFDSVQKESEWQSIGYAEYTDDFLTTALQGWTNNYTWDVEVEENKTTPGLYRLVNPYAELAAVMANSGLHQMSGKYYMVIDATVDDEVYIDFSIVGLDFDDDDSMICYSIAANLLAAGQSREQVKAAGQFGTVEGGVITFPTQTLLVGWQSMLPNLNYANVNGAFYLDLNTTTKANTPRKIKVNANDDVRNIEKSKRNGIKLIKATPSVMEMASYRLSQVDNSSF